MIGFDRALSRFFAILLGLAVIRLALGFLPLPVTVLPVVNLLLAALFLGGPVAAVYLASDRVWTPKGAALFLVAGLVVWAGLIALTQVAGMNRGFAPALALAGAQIGLATWCVGLGALLASMVREKNILIPIAIFLALYDAFLVLTPVGPTSQFLQNAPQVLSTVGMSIPAASASPTMGKAAVSGYVGPADLVFLGTFFVALFRFKLRTTETLRWMIPALVAYLVVVLIFGLPLPAMVPIGLVIMVVNAREFRLTKDEKISTAIIALIGIGLLVWGATRPRPAPQPEPSSSAVGQEAPRSAGTPGPAATDQLPSPSLPAPKSTPGLR